MNNLFSKILFTILGISIGMYVIGVGMAYATAAYPYALGGTATTTFQPGFVVYGGSSKLTQDTTLAGQLYWDATNHRLGIGTITPVNSIDITGSDQGFDIINNSTTQYTGAFEQSRLPLAGGGGQIYVANQCQNTGCTQGAYIINQNNAAGAFQATLAKFDTFASTTQLFQNGASSFEIQPGETDIQQNGYPQVYFGAHDATPIANVEEYSLNQGNYSSYGLVNNNGGGRFTGDMVLDNADTIAGIGHYLALVNNTGAATCLQIQDGGVGCLSDYNGLSSLFNVISPAYNAAGTEAGHTATMQQPLGNDVIDYGLQNYPGASPTGIDAYQNYYSTTYANPLPEPDFSYWEQANGNTSESSTAWHWLVATTSVTGSLATTTSLCLGDVGMTTSNAFANCGNTAASATIQLMSSSSRTTALDVSKSTNNAFTHLFDVNNSGSVGIGSTTPWHTLGVVGDTDIDGQFRVLNHPLDLYPTGLAGSYFFAQDGGSGKIFTGAYSDNAGAFQPMYIDGSPLVLNGRAANNVGISSTSPGTLLSLGNTGADTINISNTATSTFGHGLNILGGCFAVNGICVGVGAGTNASSTLLGDNNTFSGLDTFTGGLLSTGSTTINANATTTGTQGIGTNYRFKWNSSPDYLDMQNVGSSNPYTEARLLSNLSNVTNGAESTYSMVTDCDGQNLFNNQNFFDHTVEQYTDSRQALLSVGAAGDCAAMPLVIRDVPAGGNKNASNHIVILPNGTTAIVNAATSSVPTQTELYVASSTANEIFQVDSTPGSTSALGTSIFSVTGSGNSAGSGKVGIGTSSPSDTFTVAVGNNAGLRVDSSNSGFLEVGQRSADRFRIQNDFTQGGQLEFLYNNGSGNAPANTALTIVGNTAAAGSAAGNIGIGTTTPGALLSVAGNTLIGGNLTATGTVIFTGSSVGIATTSSANPFTIQGTTKNDLIYTGTTLDLNNGGPGGVGGIRLFPQGGLAVNFNSFPATGPAAINWSSGGAKTFEIGNSSSGHVTTDNILFGFPVLNAPADTRVGINSTTSPAALFSIAAFAGSTTPLMMMSTSTIGVATSTVFEIDKNGNLLSLNGASIGISTTTPDAAFQDNASFALAVNRQATTYTIATTTDFLIAITSTASARTVNLPQCTSTSTAGITDKIRYEIKDESGAAATNNITVTAVDAQAIDGAATKVINTNYGISRVYCDGIGGAWFSY